MEETYPTWTQHNSFQKTSFFLRFDVFDVDWKRKKKNVGAESEVEEEKAKRRESKSDPLLTFCSVSQVRFLAFGECGVRGERENDFSRN